MNPHTTNMISRTRNQSGIPMMRRSGPAANGLLVRGVVVATYVTDDGAHPYADDEPKAVYCDVLTYNTIPGMQRRLIRYALVKQERGGMHSGRIWQPRAATMDTASDATGGNSLNINGASNPGAMDGDHVLVGFMDNALNLPVILGSIPHPSSDIGNEDKDAGHRMKLKTADGDPDFWKHHGAFYGISDDGDFVVDTTDAYSGSSLENDGSEPAAPVDGSAGNYKVNLQEGATLTLNINGQTLTIGLADADAILTLGDGAVAVAIADHLQTMWASFQTVFDNHVHPTGVGPSGIPGTQATAWDSNINSNKLTVPDT